MRRRPELPGSILCGRAGAAGCGGKGTRPAPTAPAGRIAKFGVEADAELNRLFDILRLSTADAFAK